MGMDVNETAQIAEPVSRDLKLSEECMMRRGNCLPARAQQVSSRNGTIPTPCAAAVAADLHSWKKNLGRE